MGDDGAMEQGGAAKKISLSHSRTAQRKDALNAAPASGMWPRRE